LPRKFLHHVRNSSDERFSALKAMLLLETNIVLSAEIDHLKAFEPSRKFASREIDSEFFSSPRSYLRGPFVNRNAFSFRTLRHLMADPAAPKPSPPGANLQPQQASWPSSACFLANPWSRDHHHHHHGLKTRVLPRPRPLALVRPWLSGWTRDLAAKRSVSAGWRTASRRPSRGWGRRPRLGASPAGGRIDHMACPTPAG
jgi:hypothetical protein